MSRDTDTNERLWKSLGYGRKTSSPGNWRYWQHADGHWVIAAPYGAAEFEQRGASVAYRGKVVVRAKTQWATTWLALAYFYAEVVPTLPKPPLSSRSDA